MPISVTGLEGLVRLYILQRKKSNRFLFLMKVL